MGVIDSMKRAIKGTTDWLRGRKEQAIPSASTASELGLTSSITDRPAGPPLTFSRQYGNPRYRRSTTASRRAQSRRNTRYRWVSMPIPETVIGAIKYGFHNLIPRLMRQQKGTGETYNVGINVAKARVRAISNKSERKRARSVLIRELRASGIK